MAVVNLTSGAFDKVISENKKVLVDCWAVWCGPCQRMHPIFEALEAEYSGKGIVFGKVNVDEEPEIAEKLRVMSIPTFLYFEDGALKNKKIGAMTKEELATIFQ